MPQVAAEGAAPAPSARSQSRIWKDGIGSGFRPGAAQSGFSVGVGFGVRALGSKQRHDLALAMVRYGWSLGSNWEFVGELFGGGEFRPHHRYVFGITPVIRYNFVTDSRWVPFVNLGVGLSLTNIRGGDLSTRFEFNDQIGAGVHYFLSEGSAVTLQYRWFHLSNGGIRLPNNGTNTQMVLVGMSWYF